MANLTRSAQPASEWTSYDMKAFNIEVQDVDAATFFGGNNIPETLCVPPAALGLSETILNNVERPEYELSKIDRRFFRYLKEAHNLEDSGVYEFAIFLLSLMDYDRDDERLFRTQKAMPFYMGQSLIDARPNVALLTQKLNLCLLVVHTLPTGYRLGAGLYPEEHLIADSIAAFAHNRNLHSSPLQSQEIPGILMGGSAPEFYRTFVSAPLLSALATLTFPQEKTVVWKYTPPTYDRLGYLFQGLQPLDHRHIAFQHLQAFKGVIDRTTEDTIRAAVGPVT